MELEFLYIFLENLPTIWVKFLKTIFASLYLKIYYLQTLGGFPDSGRKYAVREEKSQESLPIQLDNKYGKAQSFVAGIYNPKPIVDSIQEYEKYGNDGRQHNKIGNAIVNGYEAFSNIVNAVAEVIQSFSHYLFNKEIRNYSRK